MEAKWKTKCVLVQVAMMGMLDLDNTIFNVFRTQRLNASCLLIHILLL